MRPTFVDVFCGAGGFTQGLLDAGFEHLVGIDNNPTCARTYAANHGDRVICKDVATVCAADLAPFVPNGVDLVVGSPPCQSFSMAGRRRSGDARDGLYMHLFRIAGMLQAKVVVMENVVGMMSKGGDSVFTSALQALAGMGYDVEHRVLMATDFEVPQMRKRVLVIARKHGISSPFPAPIHDFDASIGRVLRPAHEVPEHYFMQPGKVQYYAERRARLGASFVRYIDRSRPAYTLRASYFKSRGAEMLLIEPDARVRMLTEGECARLQTFPDDYIFVGARGAVYQQLGNAVPVRLAYHVGRGLMASGLGDGIAQ